MGFGNAWRLTTKLCDSCKSAAAAVFCRDDSAALCISCDTKTHSKPTHPHGRVWMCEVCEHSPAAVTCKADAAALCVTCDADIHSANPLARRHERFPVDLFKAVESLADRSTAFNFLTLPNKSSSGDAYPHDDSKVDVDAWLIPGCGAAADVNKAGDFSTLFNETDPFLDLEYGISMINPFHGTGNDGIVPDQAVAVQPSAVADLSPEDARFKLELRVSHNNKSLPSSFSFHLGQPSVSHSVKHTHPFN